MVKVTTDSFKKGQVKFCYISFVDGTENVINISQDGRAVPKLVYVLNESLISVSVAYKITIFSDKVISDQFDTQCQN